MPRRAAPAGADRLRHGDTTASSALAAGFDEHLVKPVDPDRLLDVLDRLMRRD